MNDTHNVRIGCCMIILHPEGEKILVSKRKKEPERGGWQIPGGLIDFDTGESVPRAASRETEEETGIAIERPEFLCVMNTAHYDSSNPVHIGFFGYAKSEVIPENPEPHKSENWQWVSLGNLPSGKWFYMSLMAVEFWNRLKKDSSLSRFLADREKA